MAEHNELPPSDQDLFTAKSLETERRIDTGAQELVQLGNEVDAELLFVHLLVALSTVPMDSARESTHGTVPVKIELLAYHLFPLFGASQNTNITLDHIERGTESLNTVLNTSMPIRNSNQRVSRYPAETESILAKLLIDAAVVRGSAYPHQTQEEISGIQGQFDSWFKTRVGIGPTRACALLHAIIKTQEVSSNEWLNQLRAAYLLGCQVWKELRKRNQTISTAETRTFLRRFPSAKQSGYASYAKKLLEQSPENIPVSKDTILIEPKPTEEEWLALINLVGCSCEIRKAMTAPIEVGRRPLFVLS